VARIPAQYFVFAIDEDRRKKIAEEFKRTVNDKNVNINWY
jgi:hypothetical protein